MMLPLINLRPIVLACLSLAGLVGCQQNRPAENTTNTTSPRQRAADTALASCHVRPPARLAVSAAKTSRPGSQSASHAGMVAIPAGTFLMGAGNEPGRPDEYPRHAVFVDAFWMDATEVTNAQFARFVQETGYITTAERKPDWEELRKQVPPGTPKPADNLLVASSLVFMPPVQITSLDDYGQWWQWVAGANWQHPEGPNSSIAGKASHPVVQVSWDDARAYAIWAGKRLPTEAEWEWAARGGQQQAIYPWGNEPTDVGQPKTNSWQGTFPTQNSQRDGFARTAPARSFMPNGYGLYNMAGNVWEWCNDFYRPDYYQTLARAGTASNPTGPNQSYDPQEPTVPKRVQRGGSFLCHDSYCSSYRSAARMKSSPDTGLSHAGFRCVAK